MRDCILVVDDDREIVKAISILLEGEGYEVLKAYDGLQALDILASRQVRLVLIDVMMPRLDGSRVYVTLKVDGRTAVASVKNISHMELEKDKNFTERFVRGDKSRTDGGSSLGLSIAHSFTEACGGQFELEFNADMFIVKVSFQTDRG